MIDTAREHVAQTVNAGMTMLYWQIGRRIYQDILKEKRAAYGAKIVASLSRQLLAEYGSGFTEKNKLGKFQAADKGQMELYLKWLDRYERDQSEGAPLGIILCAGKSSEHVELLELGKSGIHVASYLTELPPGDLLQKKLKEAIGAVKVRMEQESIEDETKRS